MTKRIELNLDASVDDLLIDSPTRRKVNKRRVAISGLANAAQLIGPIAKGEDITGLTNGQFSLIDIVEHVLDCIGPADVAISTWTMGVYDAEQVQSFYANKRIRSIRWLVDPSMFGRRAALAGSMVKAFGAESFRAVNTHAKFATLQNENWAITIRSSMNLNRNERLESFDIAEDRQMCDMFTKLVDQVFKTLSARSRTQSREFFEGLLAAFETEQNDAGIAASNLKSLSEMTKNLKSLPA